MTNISFLSTFATGCDLGSVHHELYISLQSESFHTYTTLVSFHLYTLYIQPRSILTVLFTDNDL